jgi:hypothetical protein
MRAIILAVVMAWLSASAAFAEAAAAPQLPRVVSPAEAASQRSRLEAAIADCERMWDRGTHMTKKEWSHTCRRVQNRIRQFELR